MRAVSVIFAILAVAVSSAPVSWFAVYNLSAAQQQEWTAKGCFRGDYTHNLNILTCGDDSEAFASLPESVSLCVIELKSNDAVARARAAFVVAEHASMGSLALETPHHLLISNADETQEFSELCSIDWFKDEADNVLFVPRSPIQPQRPVDLSTLRVFNRSRALRSGQPSIDPDENIAALLASFSRENVEANVKWFATGYSGDNTKISRNSWGTKTGSGTGGCVDSTWRCAYDVINELVSSIKSILATSGRDLEGWTVETTQWSSSYCNNVVVKTAPSSSKIVVIGAHLDSRNALASSSATGVAPGADDNGTGSAVLLEILRTLATGSYKYAEQVHFAWFCGEEQGLLGSDAMAKSYASAKAEIVGMWNNDMLGYTYPSAGVTLTFDARYIDPTLTQECKDFAALYIPGLKISSSTGCCSDQQSFYNAGFRAVGIFETPTTNVVYPDYHKATDTYNNGNINYDQVWTFGKANMACILEYAVPLPK